MTSTTTIRKADYTALNGKKLQKGRQPMLFIALFLLPLFIQAQNPKIKVYFNRFVNNAVSTGTNAIYLHNSMADTMAAYINRAKFTVDIAQYDYSASSGSSSMAVIATACNNAKARGVVVRWIYDGSQPNSGLPLLNAGINKLASPVISGYIMHDKFIVIDVNSTTATDPYLVTGSNDWGVTQTDSCYNNLVIFQDKNLANAYYLEFNKMWGGTGSAPVPASSTFGTAKTASATTSFNVNGTTVEVYFSPKDAATTHLQNAISTANNELFFGIYTFTDNTVANLIKTKYQAGISVFGIMDSYSQTNTPYTTLSPVMGANLKVFTGATSYVVYHNKTMLIDPLSPASDPQVFTGSYNWTSAGTNANDENSVIIHDANITNQYYQSFCHNFTDVGGTACPNIFTGIEESEFKDFPFVLYPNPFTDLLTLRLKTQSANVRVQLYDELGRVVLDQKGSDVKELTFDLPELPKGVYIASVQSEGLIYYQKLVK
jgi:phosphatidylserine/phosphatidylglycerophosphate/cardiolipin synthase-like enzyme